MITGYREGPVLVRVSPNWTETQQCFIRIFYF